MAITGWRPRDSPFWAVGRIFIRNRYLPYVDRMVRATFCLPLATAPKLYDFGILLQEVEFNEKL
jgi:hypothetical protein